MAAAGIVAAGAGDSLAGAAVSVFFDGAAPCTFPTVFFCAAGSRAPRPGAEGFTGALAGAEAFVAAGVL